MTFLPLGGNNHRVVTKIVTFLLRILYQITYKSVCDYASRAGCSKPLKNLLQSSFGQKAQISKFIIDDNFAFGMKYTKDCNKICSFFDIYSNKSLMKGFVKELVFTKTLQSLLPWVDIHKWPIKFEIFLIRSFVRNHLAFLLIRTHDWTCKSLMINIRARVPHHSRDKKVFKLFFRS